MEELCTIVAMDSSNVSYTICTTCEKTLVTGSTCNSTNDNDVPPFCKFCQDFKTAAAAAFITSSSSRFKRLYRLLLSIAYGNKVVVVICFDKAARVLFGCSADEFFDFEKVNPFAALNAGKILEGEMFQMKLCEPKNGNAQHLRAVSVVPLRSGFRPVIDTLRKLYRVGHSSHQVPQSRSHSPFQTS
ncbi:uncharacterized protein LOC131248874 [Magnolia sinica]|uniref:uncharacterized protein LOC131248874 n=1 Tax=Magnolia sinica TaxID=86752 RepID=UPI002657D0BF|nr:uncharacterized protein LOC131248874 [Magnolia sinica]